MGREYVWLDTGTRDGLVKASEFIRVMPKRRGTVIVRFKEIAFHQALIQLATRED